MFPVQVAGLEISEGQKDIPAPATIQKETKKSMQKKTSNPKSIPLSPPVISASSSATTISSNVQKEVSKGSIPLPPPFPSANTTFSEADDLFGKVHPDWVTEKAPGKMNLQGRLQVFLETPRTMQDCVDEFCRDNEFQKGTVWEHVKRMEKDNIVTQFDDKTFVMRMK